MFARKKCCKPSCLLGGCPFKSIQNREVIGVLLHSQKEEEEEEWDEEGEEEEQALPWPLFFWVAFGDRPNYSW